MYYITLPAENMEYLESTMETPVFDTWFAWNGLTSTTDKYSDFNATLTCYAMDEKSSLQYPKLKIHKTIYRNVWFFISLPEISHNFQCIHHYIMNLKILCIFNNLWLASRKGGDRLAENKWALKQNGRK